MLFEKLTNLKRIVGMVACACVVLATCVTGCSSSNAEKYNQSIYIYMCGSTLEAGKGWATKNIKELLSADIPEDTCVIIETGGCRTWQEYDISKTELSRYQVKNGKLKLIETLPSAGMGETDTLEDYLNFCTENYPSDKMSVIFWDHGTGSNGGVCYDTLYHNDPLTLSEMDEVFGTLKNQGKHFDLIGFDACLMANYETAEIMSNYADHMIASEELEPGGGWDYTYVGENYGQDTFYDGLLEAYAEKCKAQEKELYTLSHIDLTRFAEIEDAFSAFCSEELSENAKRRLQIVTQHADDSMCFGANSASESYSNMIDLAMFANNNGNDSVSEKIGEIITAVNGEEREGASGLSFYYPLANASEVDGYLALSDSDSYKSFLKSYYQGKEGAVNAIVFKDRGSDSNGDLAFALSAESVENVKTVSYKLYRILPNEDSGDTAYCLGYDGDVQNDGEGNYVTSFGGRWVTFNGNFIPSELVDRTGDTAIYSVSAKRNGELGNIRFSYNKPSGEFSLLGFIPIENTGNQGRLETVSKGDEITILQEVLDDSYEKTIIKSDMFIYDESVVFSVESLPDGYYQFYAVITDLYGNVYHTDVMVSEYKNGKLNGFVVTHDLDESLGI